MDEQTLVHAYIRRIGLDPETIIKAPRDQTLLTLLAEQHVLEVPFENLDQHPHHQVSDTLPQVSPQWIDFGKPQLQDPTKIIHKLIRDPKDRRGGFCFELNVAFAWLLTKLGFDAELRIGQVPLERDPQNPTKLSFSFPTHTVIVVKCQENQDSFLVEVGYGDVPRTIIPLYNNPKPTDETAEPLVFLDYALEDMSPVVHDPVGDKWRVARICQPFPVQDSEQPAQFPLLLFRQRRFSFSVREEITNAPSIMSIAGNWFPAYRFSETSFPSDSPPFVAGLREVLENQNVSFTKKRLIMKVIPGGHITLSERRIKVVLEGEISEQPVVDMAHWRELLCEKFQVSLASSQIRSQDSP